MSLLIGVGDFGLGDLIDDLQAAKTQLSAAQAQIASVQAIGGTPVADMNAVYAMQNGMGANEVKDVFVTSTKQKFKVAKTSIQEYATLDATPTP